MDIGDKSYSQSKKKKGFALSSLQSVQYSVDHYQTDSFFMRLVFEERNLDIELLNKEDFEYCMDGFELINKNLERFVVKAFEGEIYEEDNYTPVVVTWHGVDGEVSEVEWSGVHGGGGKRASYTNPLTCRWLKTRWQRLSRL